MGSLLILLLAAALPAAPVRADVRFEDCRRGSDGSLTCDTEPTGNTLLQDEFSRFGLGGQASPGWEEFEPFEGLEEEGGDPPD